MAKLSFILEWKQNLMSQLNAGKFMADEWRAFIEAASEGGYQTIADDMQKRFEHYAKEREE